MQNIIRIMILLTGVYFIYRYRYRLMNRLLSNRWLRTIAVSTAMNLPVIRRKMMEQVFK